MAELQLPSGAPYPLIGKKGNPGIDFLMVIMVAVLLVDATALH